MHSQNIMKNKNVPLKLGITGGVGSGKSVVCEYFTLKGLAVVSTDELARLAVMPGTAAYENIVNYFGADALSGDGSLDRKKLRRIITKDPDKKKMLENFVHPEVLRLMEAEFDAAKQREEPVVVFEVPLLFELGMRNFFDLTLTVCASRETQIKRMMNRDHVSYADAEALIGIQMPEEEKIRQSDVIIDNNASKEELYVQMDRFYETFIGRLNETRAKLT